jgi:nucleoside-diphosphate-sugar epimerase
MSHYLLAGAAGFIGARVAEQLLAAGHSVAGVDNLAETYDVRLKHWRLDQLRRWPAFEFHRLDITDRQALRALAENGRARPAAAVFNLAARAGVRPSLEDPWVYYQTNVTGTLNLLEWCRETGVGKFVLASSSSVYGAAPAGPCAETASTDRPVSPYAASKKAAEVLAHAYHHLHGLDVTVFRYFTVYGPAGRPDMSPFRFVQWVAEARPVTIFGDGRQTRDFTYVDDIARGTIAGLKRLGYAVVNLGNDSPVALGDMLATVERLVGQPAQKRYRPAHPADVPATWADITQARDLLGWQPSVRLEAGLAEAVRWYQANRDWARDIATDG